jgi:hypothetical protein
MEMMVLDLSFLVQGWKSNAHVTVWCSRSTAADQWSVTMKTLLKQFYPVTCNPWD